MATEAGVEKTRRQLPRGRRDQPGEPEAFDLESLIGSIPALPGVTTDDFDRLIEEATAEAVARRIEKMQGD